MPNVDHDSYTSVRSTRSSKKGRNKLDKYVSLRESKKSNKGGSQSREERHRNRQSRHIEELELKMLQCSLDFTNNVDKKNDEPNPTDTRNPSIVGNEIDSPIRKDTNQTPDSSDCNESEEEKEDDSEEEKEDGHEETAKEVGYYKVSSEVTKAIKNFKIPENLSNEGYQIKEKGKSSSVTWAFGVVLCKPGCDKNIWFCCAESICREESRTYSYRNGHSSSAARHLRIDHSIGSIKSKTEFKNLEDKDKCLEQIYSSFLFKSKPERVMEYAWADMIIENQLPFSFITAKSTRIAMELTCKAEMNRKFSVPKTKQRLVEMYASVKERITNEIKKSTDFFKFKIINLNIDLWKPSTGGHSGSKKYLGVRIYFTNYKWERVSYFLSVREFNPSFDVQTSGDSLTKVCCSYLLYTVNLYYQSLHLWLNAVMSDYGIFRFNIFSATTDGGSDVKSLVANYLAKSWELRPPHMFARAVAEAVPMSNDPVGENVLYNIRRLVNKIKNKAKASCKFEELQAEKGTTTVLKSFMSHRFLGIYAMLKRFLDSWASVEAACLSVDLKFTLAGQQMLVEQLCALIKPIADLSTKMQAQNKPLGWSLIVQLHVMRSDGCLNENAPFKKLDGNGSYRSLCATVKEIQKNLILAMDKRFYIPRYFQLSRDLIFECQCVLTPAIRHTFYLRDAIAAVYKNELERKGSTEIPNRKSKKSKNSDAAVQDVDSLTAAVKAKIQADIISYAIKVNLGKKLDLEGQSEVESPRVADTDWDFGSYPESRCDIPQENVCHIIKNEFKNYMATDVTRKEQQDLLAYWRSVQHNYPHLSIVAAAIFGVPCSAAGIEVNFGQTKRMVTSERTSMSATTIEMCQVVNRNSELLNLGQITEIDQNNLKSYYPTSPNTPGLDSNDATEEDGEDDEFFELSSSCIAEKN